MVLFAAACVQSDTRPNLVLLVLDTVGPAHVSAYGYAQPTTPFLERFAARAERFDRAYSTSSWTLPAHASAFTGLDSARHGADQVTQRLSARSPTLAELLLRAGYQTAGFSNNPWVSHDRGTARGFASFSELFRLRESSPPTVERHATVVGVSEWLTSERNPDQPWFLFVNLSDAHYPYSPPWEHARPFFETRHAWRTAVARLAALNPMNVIRLYYLAGLAEPVPSAADIEAARRLYDAEIRYVDAIVERLVRDVENASKRPTLIAIASDHGENFGEHGHMGHAFSLYDSTLRIVLLVGGPGFEPGSRNPRLVQISDLFPTFLRAAGAEMPDGIDGVDLLASSHADRGLSALYAHPFQAFNSYPDRYRNAAQIERLDRELRAGIVGNHKLIRRSDGFEELFDLRADPDEAQPLEGVSSELLQRLRQLAGEPRTHPTGARGKAQPMDADTRRSLEALGYLEPDAH